MTVMAEFERHFPEGVMPTEAVMEACEEVEQVRQNLIIKKLIDTNEVLTKLGFYDPPPSDDEEEDGEDESNAGDEPTVAETDVESEGEEEI